MTPILRHLCWLAVLLAILTIACICLAWMQASAECKGMPATWPPSQHCEYLKFFYDWQQLIAGLIAIAAAIIGWLAINRQVRQGEEQERERVRSRHAAARAMLPLALSGISDYAHDCADELVALYRQRDGEVIPKAQGLWPRPSVPAGPTGDLHNMVEASAPVEVRR